MIIKNKTMGLPSLCALLISVAPITPSLAQEKPSIATTCIDNGIKYSHEDTDRLIGPQRTINGYYPSGTNEFVYEQVIGALASNGTIQGPKGRFVLEITSNNNCLSYRQQSRYVGRRIGDK